MNALVLGSTGVVGDAILREALQDPRLTVAAVTRRPLKLASDRLRAIRHEDFANFRPLEEVLASTDVVICALGISWYQTAGEAEYRLITHDYVMACARVAAVANAAVQFCFISGQGAAINGAQAWARIRGQTEHDLAAVFGSRLTVFRPGYIHPYFGREQSYWGDAVMRPLMPLRPLLSRWMTDSREVARAVLYCATGGKVPSPATNRDIIGAAAAYRLQLSASR